nr:MAG: RNA-dependent RNA polymerase [Riboviria sp.]
MPIASLQLVQAASSFQFPNGVVPEFQSFNAYSMDGVTALGTVAKQCANNMPRTTQYIPVNLDTGWPVENLPAKLAPFTNSEGETISPLNLCYSEYAHVESVPPIPFVDVDDLMFPNRPRSDVFQELSFEDAIFGNKALGIHPLDPSKSQGPFLKSIGKTRSQCFDMERRVIAPFFRDILESYYQALKEGPCPMWINDTLKDELRDKARVLAGKSRLFYVMDLARLVVGKKIFGLFAQALEESPTEATIAVGINPTSLDWAHLASRLGLFSPDNDVWVFDQKKFDIKMRYNHTYNAALNILPRIHPDSRAIAAHYMQSYALQVHVTAGRRAYLTSGKNPSGDFLTSIKGSYVSAGLAKDFFSTIGVPFRATFYSDDALLTVPKKYKADPMDLKAFAASRYGLELTAVDKTPTILPVTAEQAEFLARRFVRRGDRILAPLDLSTIHAMLQYVKTDDESLIFEQVRSRINSALLESLQHGEAVYLDVLRVSRILADHYRVNFPIQTYAQASAALKAAHYFA